MKRRACGAIQCYSNSIVKPIDSNTSLALSLKLRYGSEGSNGSAGDERRYDIGDVEMVVHAFARNLAHIDIKQ